MKLKENIGKLVVGRWGLITPATPSARIKQLLKERPDLSHYFEDGKKASKKDPTGRKVLEETSSDKTTKRSK